jgi:DNA-binding NarL/FixJ family response regulator
MSYILDIFAPIATQLATVISFCIKIASIALLRNHCVVDSWANARGLLGASAMDAGEASGSPGEPDAVAESELIAETRLRADTLETELAKKETASSANFVPLMIGPRRPEVSLSIFEALREMRILPRDVPLHILFISLSTEERLRVNALTRTANEQPNSLTTISLHEAVDVNRAVGLLRAGTLCNLVLYNAEDADGDAIRLRQAVSQLRQAMADTVPLVVAMPSVEPALIRTALTCGADTLTLSPIGVETLADAWQRCIRRDPTFFEHMAAAAIRPRAAAAEQQSMETSPAESLRRRTAAAASPGAAGGSADELLMGGGAVGGGIGGRRPSRERIIRLDEGLDEDDPTVCKQQ